MIINRGISDICCLSSKNSKLMLACHSSSAVNDEGREWLKRTRNQYCTTLRNWGPGRNFSRMKIMTIKPNLKKLFWIPGTAEISYPSLRLDQKSKIAMKQCHKAMNYRISVILQKTPKSGLWSLQPLDSSLNSFVRWKRKTCFSPISRAWMGFRDRDWSKPWAATLAVPLNRGSASATLW